MRAKSLRPVLGLKLALSVLLGSLVVVPVTARAEHTRFYNLEGFGNFLDGNPEGTAVTEDGSIVLPPKTTEWWSDADVILTAAAGLDDEVVLARMNEGQVFAVDRKGKTRPLFKMPDDAKGWVTALTVVGDALYVAAGLPVKIYQVQTDAADPVASAKEAYAPDAKFVWDMAPGPPGSVLLATGMPGTVVELDKKGKGKVLFALGDDQEHVRTVRYNKSLGVFVGGGARGVVYRSQDLKTLRALYDTGHTEVTSLVVAAPYVYAAGVTGAGALVGASSGKPKPKVSKGKNGTGGGAAAAAAAAKAKAKRAKGKVSSQIVQVAMDGTAQILAGSNDEGVLGMGFGADGQLLVATGGVAGDDPRGRLYGIVPAKRQVSLVWQSPSQRLTHLVALSGGHLAAVSAGGARITQVHKELADSGTFLTVPYDVGINARFGALRVFGHWPKGTKVTASLRTGATSKPDDSWSDWSNPMDAPGPQAPQVARGRFMQVRLTLERDGRRDPSPQVHRVRLAYLRHNVAPMLGQVVALPKGVAMIPVPADGPKPKTVDVGPGSKARHSGNGTGKGTGRNGAHRGRRARQVPRPGALTIRWEAEDPNHDDLAYSLYVRASSAGTGEGAGPWRLLDEELEQSFYTIESSQLPDGYYQFRVVASDAPSNPRGVELTDERESRAVLIDNTAPRVADLDVDVERARGKNGGAATVRFGINDAVGPLRSAEYALDGETFRPLMPTDGVLDGPKEHFKLELHGLNKGAHVINVRAIDEAENEGVGSTSFQVR